MNSIARFLVLWVLALSTALVSMPTYAVPAMGQRIMIAGPSSFAIENGKEVARSGGNVVDVAVAVALSLAVTSPYYASLGGGGFAMVHIGSQTEALDFRESAPKLASADMYKDKPINASIDGGLAVGVPGIPAGLWALHKKYGKLHWSQLFQGAIRLASKGFQASGEWAKITRQNKDRFSVGGKKLFLGKDGRAYLPGDSIKQPGLALLLGEMSNRGIVPFYNGMGSRDMVSAIQASGGKIQLQDFETYAPRWLAPLKVNYDGYSLDLMPPPSSGGVVIASALKLIELSGMKSKRPLSVDEFHWLGEILKLSFRGRSLLGDPTFTKNPVEELLNEKFLRDSLAQLKADKALDTSSSKLPPLPAVPAAAAPVSGQAPPSAVESKETTHFSVMDKDGNAVAMTLTLNGSYGSGVVSEKYGIALNNEMDDFTTRPGQGNMYGLVQGSANKVEAGKRPLSSMSPTLVEKDGHVVLAVGAPGGPRIISAVLQTLYRRMTLNWDLDLAIQSPRLHHQFAPDILYFDSFRVSPDVLDALRSKGHKVEESSVGKVYGVARTSDGLLEGAFDSRGEGAAGGF